MVFAVEYVILDSGAWAWPKKDSFLKRFSNKLNMIAYFFPLYANEE